MGIGKMDQAYKLFERNIDNYPQSANAYDSLGEYFVNKGDKPKAIQAYTKSLSLQETTDTRRKLNELEKQK
jgi:tetratricopeptide (TPR) repeat protein